VEVYRQHVAQLQERLRSPDATEALEAARALIDKVVISPPEDDDDPPVIELVGDLQAMLHAASGTARSTTNARNPTTRNDPVLDVLVSSMKAGQGPSAPAGFSSCGEAVTLAWTDSRRGPMPDTSLHDALIAYADAIRKDRAATPGIAGDGTGLELLLAPRFQRLMEDTLRVRFGEGAAVRVLPEYRKSGVGRPDLALARPPQPARAFVELKAPDKGLRPTQLRGHDRAQFERFKALPLWGYCNFHTIHLYRRDAHDEEAVIVPASALDPDTPAATAERLIRRSDPAPFLAIVETLALAQPPPMRTAQDVAEALAHAARLVRGITLDACREGAPAALDAVRAEFRDTLFAHAEAGGYDERDETALFANAFAQTLAFGLLLARDASVKDVDQQAYRLLPEGSYPLLRATLRALTQDEIVEVLGAGFDVILDTVNAVDPAVLAKRNGHDPILYFYEDFLATFDPVARKRHGVYFTPVPVVRFMVAATDRALRAHLGTNGLLDRDVLVLDPACGTGTFLLAAASAAAERAAREMGEGAVAGELTKLAKRLYGFELLVGPYTVAHYRLQRELLAAGASLATRLKIYLADTLAAATDAPSVTPHLGFMSHPIVEERKQADAVKARTKIIAIIGNPPYKRLRKTEVETLVGSFVSTLWNDLKQPVRDAGWGRSLNPFPDLYVAFYRWSLWKLFEQTDTFESRVLCLITNRAFLAGRAFGGLRRMLRRRFDTIEIIDLRGDNRGALPAVVDSDEGVFDIETGVCVLTAWVDPGGRAQGAPKPEAEVRYADVWLHGAYRRAEKLALLRRAVEEPSAIRYATIEAEDMENLRPIGFRRRDWPSIEEFFVFKSNGIVTYRDDFAYATKHSILADRIKRFLSLPIEQAQIEFKETRDRKAAPAHALPFDEIAIEPVLYRPMDRRFLCNRREFIDFGKPDLQAAWGKRNVALFAADDGTGSGPAAWVHGQLPDQHAFRGSYGGWVFPLYDRRNGPDAHNLNPDLLSGLEAAYARRLGPEDLFHAIAALLSATSYTRRFAWDLEEAFPHIPFPEDRAVFEQAARIGAEIAALETFARQPAAAFRTARLAGKATGVTLQVPPIGRAFLPDGSGNGAIPLQHDGSLRLALVPQRVFDFGVSGYPVLHRWLAARAGEPLAEVQRDALDVVWRLAELLHWFDEADPVLEAALARPLTRAMLGL
jgi:hypothetical protein